MENKKYTVTTPSTTKVVAHFHEAVAEIEYEWRRFVNAVKRDVFHFRAFITGPDGAVEAIFWDGT